MSESTQPADEFGIEAVRELLQLLSETDVTEIQIERGASKLHIKRGTTSVPLMITPALAQGSASAHYPSAATAPGAPPFGHPAAAPAAPTEYEPPPGSQLIVSPMVGTFYGSASPKDPVFVQEGDPIQPGDVVGIVEAMKIMNEIDSEVAGRITKILVSNGQPVEYGQPLMVIEPN